MVVSQTRLCSIIENQNVGRPGPSSRVDPSWCDLPRPTTALSRAILNALAHLINIVLRSLSIRIGSEACVGTENRQVRQAFRGSTVYLAFTWTRCSVIDA